MTDAHLNSVVDGKIEPPDAPDAWEPPEPLVESLPSLEYPLDALPSPIREAVEEVQRHVQAPPAIVAGAALAALSTAAQGFADVGRDSRLTGPCGLFLLTIAESGERKSSCDGYFTEAIAAHERAAEQAAAEELRNYAADSASWAEQQLAGRKKVQSAAPNDKRDELHNARQHLRDLEDEKPEEPRVPKLLRGDDTPESLSYDLVHRWPIAGVICSEGGVVLGAAGMSKDSVMRNLSRLNVLWDGGSLPISRRTSESFTVRGARVTFSLQVQGDTLRAFFAQSGTLARGSGFLARFLIACPESTRGTRMYKPAPKNWPALTAFNNAITRLLSAELPITDQYTLEPPVKPLSPDAKAAWVEFHDEIERQLGGDGELADVADVASKTADNAARLACLFHLMQFDGTGAISKKQFNAGAKLALWYLLEAQRFFRQIAVPPKLAAADRLSRWLVERARNHDVSEVPIRDIQQRGPSEVRQKEKCDAALELLAKHYHIRDQRGGRRRVIEINPKLIQVGK